VVDDVLVFALLAAVLAVNVVTARYQIKWQRARTPLTLRLDTRARRLTFLVLSVLLAGVVGYLGAFAYSAGTPTRTNALTVASDSMGVICTVGTWRLFVRWPNRRG
jgi:hypothetical protein